MATALSVVVGVAGAPPAGAGPAPVMVGYVPLPTDDFTAFLRSINGTAGTTADFTVGITNAASGAVMYYDQWEDGFEADIANPVQSTTQVFGDGVTGNGDAATYCSVCAGDLLPQGAALIMRNNVPTPRASTVLFDGGDKVASTRGIAITAGGFGTSLGSVLSGVVSAYDTAKYGTSYTVPVGQATGSFNYTGVSVMASAPGTLVEVDTDGDGDVDSSATVGVGRSHFVDGGLLAGARVTASAPVQVHLLTGVRGSGYEARSFTLFPDDVLTDDYLSPAAGPAGNPTVNHLYNPGASSITVSVQCGSGCSTSIAVPARSLRTHTAPAGTAVRYSATGTFIGLAAIGAGASGSANWDWGYTMVPTSQLTSQVVLGWAPGNSSNPPSGSPASYNPVWVTPLAAATIRVDYDGNPTTGALAAPGGADCFGARFDIEIPVGAFVSQKITDPNDADMTGARVYTCDDTQIAGAWGEDPSVATVGSPGFDAGYTIIPTTTMVLEKTGVLGTDVDDDGLFGPGDTMTYEIAISDAGSLAFTDVVVEDVLPDGLAYVAGSTVLDTGATTPTAIADDISPPAATVFPLDENGVELPSIGAGQTVVLRFDAEIVAPWTPVSSIIGNTACVTAAEASACDTSQTVIAEADVSLTKVVRGTAPALVGDQATFRITATNDGPDVAGGVEVTDLLPSGLTFVSATPSAGTYDDATGIWAVGNLADGASATLDLVATVDTDAPTTNYAQVTGGSFVDPDSQPAEGPFGPGNPPDQDDEAIASVDVAPRVDLELTKAVSSAPTADGTTQFTITVDNRLAVAAPGVRVTERPPAGATFVSAVPSQGTFDSATGVWDVGTVPADGARTLVVSYRLASFPATNRAEITASIHPDIDSQPAEGPLDAANPPNQDDEDDVVVTSSYIDLSLTKSATSPAFIGQNSTFTLDVTNAGPADATDVEVEDQLPAGLTFVSATATQGAYDDATGIWTVGDLDAGATPARLTITARLDVAGPVTNVAEVSAADQPDVDSTPANDEPDEDDQDEAAVSASGAAIGDRVWDDIDGDGTQDPGEAGRNGVVLTLLRDVDENGSFETTVGTRTTAGDGAYLFGDLPAGSYRVSVDPTTVPTGVVATTATSVDLVLSAGETDLTADIGYSGAADLSLVKELTEAPTYVGDVATFTITVRNDGPVTATGVRAIEALPAGLDLVSGSATQGFFDPTTGSWTVGSLADGSSATLTITATVTSAAPLTNRAQVTASDQVDPDSTPGNDEPDEDDYDVATVDVEALADLSVTKSQTGSPVHVGDQAVFRVAVANAGPSTATGVEVTDLLPAGLTYVSHVAAQGTYVPATGVWTVGAVPVGEERVLTVTARVDVLSATNTAELTDANETDPDSTPDNGDAEEDDQASAAVSVDPLIDLSVTKDLGTAPTHLGDTATFAVTVANAGPSTATGVQVVDQLPAGLTYVSDDAAGDYDPATGIWTVGTVSVGGSRTLVITVVVEVLESRNLAEVTAATEDDVDSQPAEDALGPENDPNQDDEDAQDVSVGPLADLSLTKTSAPATVDQLDEATFTLTVSNDGPSTATGVDVTDLLPAGVTYVDSDATQGTYDPVTGLWEIGTLKDGDSVTLDITVTVTGAGTITNVAEITHVIEDDPDSTPDNGDETEDDQDSATLSSDPVIDLSVAKTVSAASAHVGSEVDFTVTVTNDGPSPATGVEVTDLLPAGTELVDHATSQGTWTAATGAWTVGDLAVGDDATLTITARVTAPGDTTNVAEVTDADQLDVDSQPAEDPLGPDDAPNQDDEAAATVAGVQIDLELDLSVDDTEVNVGDQVTYTVVLTNQGPSGATGVSVTDLLPAGLTFVSATPGVGSFDPVTGTWTIGDLAVDETVTLEIVATVVVPGPIVNVAQVATATEPDVDSTPGNDDAEEDDQDDVTIGGLQVDLSLTKEVDDETPDLGSEVTYRLTLANEGPSTATGIVVVDQLPTGLTWLSDTSGGSYDPVTGRWTVGSLAADASVSIDITARLTVVGETSNRASVDEADQPDVDSTPGNSDPAEDDEDTVVVVAQVASVAGTIWLDVDGDGTFDADEPTIGGVAVQLLDADGDLVATTTTDAGGDYEFTDLAPGDYTIVVDPSTLPDTIDGQSYDPDSVTDNQHGITLEAGDNVVDIDFGYRPIADPVDPVDPPVQPETPVTGITGNLPVTGVDAWAQLRLGLGLVGIGLGLVVLVRRRRPVA